MPTGTELHECEKLSLTPDSCGWNPQCKSYKRNEQSMIDFEGNMCEPSRRLDHQVVLEKKDDAITDLSSTMASVSTSG